MSEIFGIFYLMHIRTLPMPKGSKLLDHELSTADIGLYQGAPQKNIADDATMRNTYKH